MVFSSRPLRSVSTARPTCGSGCASRDYVHSQEIATARHTEARHADPRVLRQRLTRGWFGVGRQNLQVLVPDGQAFPFAAGHGCDTSADTYATPAATTTSPVTV